MQERLPFPQQLKRELQRRGWSQGDLAERIRVSTKTVGRWERGEVLPQPYARQKLIEVLGKDAEELGLAGDEIARVARESAEPEKKVDVEVEEGIPEEAVPIDQPSYAIEYQATHTRSPLYRVDLNEAPDTEGFCGREEECQRLTRWITGDACQVVSILGMGGMGKTMLAARVARQVSTGDTFDYVFWRSLQHAPPLEYTLKQCIQFFSEQRRVDLPTGAEEQISVLMGYLREHRCLLILDNAESILQEGRRAGQYRPGYENYGRLIQLIGETRHKSCLLLTSREKPKEVVPMDGKMARVRSLQLPGVRESDGQELLSNKELRGSDEQWAELIRLYAGNPLALKLVAEYIQELFDGEIGGFLQVQEVAIGDINDLLERQLQRLSQQELEVLDWLAIERESVSRKTIWEDLLGPVAIGVLLETLDSLRRRSMIEIRESGHFTLQPVIMEYVTKTLVKRLIEEFDTPGTYTWTRYALVKAQSKDYVRDGQKRFILEPIAQQLMAVHGRKAVEHGLQEMLAFQRQVQTGLPDYLAANVLHLLILLGHDLHGLDLSGLTIRQAYLQHILLQATNFAYSHFLFSIFTNLFGAILAVAFEPASDSLVAGTTTGDILMYEASTGTLLQTFQGHTDGVWCVAFSPNSNTLASSSDDSTIRIWDINTGESRQVLTTHTNRVRAIAFSPDGKLLASGSDDRTICLWQTDTWQCLRILKGHSDRIWCVAFSPDSTMLASGSTDRTICLWDLADNTKEESFQVLRRHTDSIRSLAFTSDGSLLASGSDDHTVCLWNIQNGECVKTLMGHTNRVWSIAFSLNGSLLVSGSEDRTIRLWDTNLGQCIKTMQGHMHGVRSIAFSAGRKLASGSDDQSIRLWDIHTGESLKTLYGYANRIRSIAFCGSQNTLVSASEDQVLRLWDVSTENRVKPVPALAQGIIAIAASADGRFIASGGEDHRVRIWDVRTGQCLKICAGHTNWVRAVAFHPAGRMLASGGEDNTIYLWDAKTAQQLKTLQGHTSWVRAVAFHPHADLLASAADDATVRLWDIQTGQCLRVFEGHTNNVRSIAFAPDGKLLASGSEDTTIRLWETDTGSRLAVLNEHTDRVLSVAFSPDGQTLASSGNDLTIRLWNVATGQSTAIADAHTHRIRSVVFNSDGSLLASGSDDGTIRLWSFPGGECVKTLISERPYERMNITGASGLTEAQKAALLALGAIEL